MKSESDEILELEEALRGDLPGERDAARLRARLAGLGLGVGVTLTSATAGALAGSKSAAPAGIWGFLSSLPVGAKVGVATMVTASAVAGPVYYSKNHEPSPAVAQPQSATKPAARPLAVRAAEPGAALRAPEPVREAALEPTVVEATPAPLSERIEAATPRQVTPERAARRTSEAVREAPPLGPAVTATLGEETRLIDAALSALRRGDRSTAAELIRQHERRFPDGLLRRERERAHAALIENLENRHDP